MLMIKMVSAPSSIALALLHRQCTQEIDLIQNFLNGIVYIVSRHDNPSLERYQSIYHFFKNLKFWEIPIWIQRPCNLVVAESKIWFPRVANSPQDIWRREIWALRVSKWFVVSRKICNWTGVTSVVIEERYLSLHREDSETRSAKSLASGAVGISGFAI